MPEGQDLGHAAGLRAVSARGHSEGGDEPVVGSRAVNSNGPAWNDRVALGAGRQPKFGRREQLVPDGLNDPIKHLQAACKLDHPFHATEALKSDHAACFEWEQATPHPDRERLELLSRLRKLKQDASVRARDLHLKSKAGVAARKLGLHMDLGLMEAAQQLVSLEDQAIPLLCSLGLPITGRASESPFFDPQVEPQKVSAAEFQNTCKRRRQAFIRRTAFMAQKGGHDMSVALHKKVLQEVQDGSMGPALSPEAAVKEFGEHFNAVPSFGLLQGLNSKNEPKYRRIDDHSAGWVNMAAKRTQRISMATADYIAVMLRHVGSRPSPRRRSSWAPRI